jgi:asparagine synthase (glutamine-hydrolysing)
MNAALKPAAALLADPVSDARLRGWVDFRQFAQGSGLLRVEEDAGRAVTLSAPWMAVQLNPRDCDVHRSERSIVVALGRPTLKQKRVDAAAIGKALDAGALAKGELGGRFALVAIDLTRGTVQLQTDRFGVWPLCWSRHEERLAFSDRADCVPTPHPAQLDAQALFNYVYFHVIPAPRTAFRGVSRLEPATVLGFDGRTLSASPSWSPDFCTRREGTLDALSARFREAIRVAVEDELDEGATVGCFLSGGTDSSTVAGTLKQVAGRAATFSMGFEQRGYDEMEYARIAARHFGTAHHEHYVTPAELVAAIPDVASHYDQPFGNSSAVPAFICARLARDSGVTRLLAGDGGDELFGGNTRYAKQKIFEAWWGLTPPLRGALTPLAANRLTRSLPFARKAASYVDQASVPMPARLETYNLLRRFGARNVFAEGFRAMVDEQEPPGLQAAIYGRQHAASFVDRMLAYDWRFTLADNDLPKVTGTTQLAGIAVGFPLLSDALVDISMKLAPSDKVRGLKLRHFFKASLAGFLPQEIIDKKKHGFGLPVGAWLVSDAAFRNLARESVTALAERGVIERALPDDLFSRRLEEHAGYYGEMIWVLMMMEQWLAARAPAWRPG